MSGLYRCRCRIGYRPYSTDKIIMFDERQVVSASVNLVFQPNTVSMNTEGRTGLTEFGAALVGSTANVTLSDPYMTGVAWAALFDSAAAYSNSSAAAIHNIFLPTCGEGENPSSGKCHPDPYRTIEDPNLRSGALADFAHILVVFYYEVAGTTFSQETYFRLENFSISHGKQYPQVSLRGVEPQTIIFNQTLENFQLKENKTLEENLTTIIDKYDYQASFCVPPNTGDDKPYIMPKAFKEKNVTAAEIIRKYVKSVNGSVLSMPTKEYARKISLCTRASVNQGCSVFYLGKGLYEGYDITGQVDPNFANLNTEYNQELGLGYNYDSAPLNEGKRYKVENLAAAARKEKLKSAQRDKTQFPFQFAKYEKRYADKYATSGYVWTAANGPDVTTERVQNTNIYGVGVNGTKPKAMLDGTVLSSTSKDAGKVLIGTNYFLRYCVKEQVEGQKCWNTAIYQESVNLKTVKEGVKVGAKVKINEEIGTATDESPEFIRFYIAGNGRAREITISPNVVWNYAIPVEKLTDEEKKTTKLKSTEGSPSGPVTPTGSSGFIGRVGSTGGSTGPHLHAEWEDKRPIDVNQVREFVKVKGNPGSPYGAQRPTGTHRGVDINGNDREPIELINGATLAQIVENTCTVENDSNNTCGGRFGNYVIINTPKGRMILAHLAPNTIKGTPGGSSTGSKFGSGVQSGPSPVGARVSTEFKGVPRALRIVPGRTVLSFITDYDEWVEQGRPANIDPGVWIAGRFKNWFIYGANYTWNQGDLRVSLTGSTDWGNITSRINVPPFEDYVKSFGTRFEYTKDYYGYIRSLGDLCWNLEGGKNSCEEICKEAQDFQNYFKASEGRSPDVSGSFPPSQCQYTGTAYKNKKAEIEQVMGALRTMGINTREAYAGVLGNLADESGFDSNVHNTSRQRFTCTTDSSNPPAGREEKCYGIAQWGGIRKQNILRKYGQTSSLTNQLQFMASEIKEGKDARKDTPQIMNGAKSPEQAANLWNEYYERGRGGKENRRRQARVIYDGLKCERANP